MIVLAGVTITPVMGSALSPTGIKCVFWGELWHVVLILWKPVLATVAMAAFTACSAWGHGENLLNDDNGLLHFVMPQTEYLRDLRPCKDLRLRRSVSGGEHMFRIRGECNFRNPPAGDCYGYSLEADGTVDTTTNATIRKFTLKLLCTA